MDDLSRFETWHAGFPVKVVKTEQKGRHMIATKDISAGETLLSDFPYCWVVDEPAKFFVCQNCFLEVQPASGDTPPAGFLMCSECNQTGYCSEECLMSDYPQHSQDECSMFKHLETSEYSPSIVTEIKLLIRTLSRKWLELHIAECGSSYVSQHPHDPSRAFANDNGLRYADYSTLITNQSNFPEHTLQSLDYWICDYIRRLAHWVGGHEEDNTELLEILLRNRCNAFYIQGRTLDEKTSGETRGCGVYVRNSFFNHSCAPNVSYWVVENTLQVECTATVPAQAGTELCISYIDTALPLAERRAKLLESYMFRCDCTKCIAEEKEEGEDNSDSKPDETLAEAVENGGEEDERGDEEEEGLEEQSEAMQDPQDAVPQDSL